MKKGILAFVVLVGTLPAMHRLSADDRPWLSRVPAEQQEAENPIPLDRTSVGKGKIAYENACVSCHGKKGQGDGPAAQYLDPKPKPLHINGQLPLPDGVVHWVITNGIDGTPMASLQDALTVEERWHVINYLHAMAQHYGPKTTPTPAPTPEVAASPVGTPEQGEIEATATPAGTAVAATPAPEASPTATQVVEDSTPGDDADSPDTIDPVDEDASGGNAADGDAADADSAEDGGSGAEGGSEAHAVE